MCCGHQEGEIGEIFPLEKKHPVAWNLFSPLHWKKDPTPKCHNIRHIFNSGKRHQASILVPVAGRWRIQEATATRSHSTMKLYLIFEPPEDATTQMSIFYNALKNPNNFRLEQIILLVPPGFGSRTGPVSHFQLSNQKCPGNISPEQEWT